MLGGREKICSFDCGYCQVGRTKKPQLKRKVYVPTRKLMAELKALPELKIDFITFSGCGEPTLAKNLGRAISAIRKIRPEPIAVLTNASLLFRKQVCKELALADLVAVKLDADSERLFQTVNQPAKSVKLAKVLQGIEQFRQNYQGSLMLQIMFTRQNKSYAKSIARLARQIQPDQIQICTPTRPSPLSRLSRKEIFKIKSCFRAMPVVCVYDLKRKKVRPINKNDTRRRRGKHLE